jgi:hypothetical protein
MELSVEVQEADVVLHRVIPFGRAWDNGSKLFVAVSDHRLGFRIQLIR